MNHKYILDQADQVLNLKDNYYNHHGMNSRLYGVFAYVLEEQTNQEFKNSLIKSEELCKMLTFKESISGLKNNDSNSFFIVTIHTEEHCIASVVRKIENNFHLTLVNVAEENPSRRFTEYIFKNENYDNLILCLNLGNIEGVGRTLHYYSKPSLDNLYKEYLRFSDLAFPLNVLSLRQKIGNCMVKEPEKGIKYAFSTRKFTKGDFAKLRIHSKEDIKKNPFKPKWTPSTLEIHKLYIDQLKKEYPQYEKLLDRKFNIYIKNKELKSKREAQHVYTSEKQNGDIHKKDRDFLSKLFFCCARQSVKGNDEVIKMSK